MFCGIYQNNVCTYYSDAEKKLKDLEKDRLKLDRELRMAREKIVMSERGKEVIETRMKVSCL